MNNKKTRQGVRDLDSMFPKTSRGKKPSREALDFANGQLEGFSFDNLTQEEMQERQLSDDAFYDQF